METLIVDTLKVWRAAERLLQDLPPVDPDHETVRMLVIKMRDMYARLSDTKEARTETIAAGRTQIDAAWQLLEKIQREF